MGIKKLLAPIEKPFAKRPFARFLTKKLIFLLVAIFLSFTLLFILPYFMASNPVDLMITRLSQTHDVTRLAALREQYIALFGLDKPLIDQYGLFWNRVLTMNFGPSIAYNMRSVGSLVGRALVWTLSLIIPVLILTVIVGNSLGARIAFSKSRFLHAFYTFAVYLNSSPYYWFGLLLVFAFAVNLKLFPIYGGYSPYVIPSFSLSFFLDVAYHWVLPFLSLFIAGIGGWAMGMRAMTIYERGSDYVYYSEQMGFTKSKLRKYAQRNAILPLITGVPAYFGALVGQSLLVEYVFGWPGLGTLMFNSVHAIDYPLMQGIFVFTVLVVLIGNFLIDILYGFIDPRIRTGYVGD
ncbi:Dipeptide transport system permease protein DppB [subsurface metagenome]